MIGAGMRRIAPVIAALLAAPAGAQSVEDMLGECAAAGRVHFGEPHAQVQMQYNGVRVDGTHAVGGTALLEARPGPFACSFAPPGRPMTEFYADGVPQALPGGSLRTTATVAGVPAGDVLNMRSGPGTQFGITGAMVNGTTVRVLRCEIVGSGLWCEIEMRTEMRERGWVNARFLYGV